MIAEISHLEQKISDSYLHIQKKEPLDESALEAIHTTISLLDQGKIRVANKVGENWVTHHWIKQAILLYFYASKPKPMSCGLPYYDHTPYKYAHQQIEKKRILPTSYIRHGAYIGENTIVMPSFINMGAYIDDGCMIDTYASIGSCAQIGKNVHISAGTGIGGVLEPLQALPTIIEDNCFIGARSEISEGVIVQSGAVLASGLYLSQSTRIYNRLTDEISYGVVPKNAVVVPGSVPAKNGKYNIAAAIIVKIADEKTRNKTQLNDLLRNFE